MTQMTLRIPDTLANLPQQERDLLIRTGDVCSKYY